MNPTTNFWIVLGDKEPNKRYASLEEAKYVAEHLIMARPGIGVYILETVFYGEIPLPTVMWKRID